jgi:hypothetical protein
MRAFLSCCSLTIAFCVAAPPSVTAQREYGVVTGHVLDESDGVVPGVAVVATSSGQQILTTAVTDETGAFSMDMPAGPATLSFELDGFETSTLSLTVHAGRDSWVSGRLYLASLTEHVVVRGEAEPEPARFPPPKRLPPPAPVPVPGEELEGICGPDKPTAETVTTGTIRPSDGADERALYGLGDEVTIEGGTDVGLTVGLNLASRRYFRTVDFRGLIVTGQHTAGVVQIVGVSERAARAVVIYACNELMAGDLLSPFRPQPLAPSEPVGRPVYRDAARILFADLGQMLGVEHRRLVIDRGRADGFRPGQRLTLFRPGPDGRTRVLLGEALVVAVREDSARILVERSADAIWTGDYAAPHELRSDGTPVARISHLRPH